MVHITVGVAGVCPLSMGVWVGFQGNLSEHGDRVFFSLKSPCLTLINSHVTAHAQIIPITSSLPFNDFCVYPLWNHSWFLVLITILRTVTYTCIFSCNVPNVLWYLFTTALPPPFFSSFCIPYCFSWKRIKIHSTIIHSHVTSQGVWWNLRTHHS